MVLKVQRLGWAGGGLLLGAVAIAIPVEAAIISKHVEVKITDGDLYPDESFFGTLTYDDSFLTGMGYEELSVGMGLESFDFTYVGSDLMTPTTYTLFDDIDYPDFPKLGFTDGMLTGFLDGLLYEASVSDDVSFFFDGQFFGTDEFSTGRYNDGKVFYTASVPEPATVLGLLALGGFGIVSQRRRRSA
ncbi:MAG: PEP-CTERM sorting domain-containing protein [Cyanobacteria bacterium J06554_6]